MLISAIVAVAENGIIGYNNSLPWHSRTDLTYFKEKTRNAPILMGRKCYESIGKPLPFRKNIVISTKLKIQLPNIFVFDNISDALFEASKTNPNEIFIIGGSQIYKETANIWNKVYLTKMHCLPLGDTYFDFNLLNNFSTSHQIFINKTNKDDCDMTFLTYELNS